MLLRKHPFFVTREIPKPPPRTAGFFSGLENLYEIVFNTVLYCLNMKCLHSILLFYFVISILDFLHHYYFKVQCSITFPLMTLVIFIVIFTSPYLYLLHLTPPSPSPPPQPSRYHPQKMLFVLGRRHSNFIMTANVFIIRIRIRVRIMHKTGKQNISDFFPDFISTGGQVLPIINS